MRRGIKTFTALTLLALAVVAVSYGGAQRRRSSARRRQLPAQTGPR